MRVEVMRGGGDDEGLVEAVCTAVMKRATPQTLGKQRPRC